MNNTITITPILNQNIQYPVSFKQSEHGFLNKMQVSLDLPNTKKVMGKFWIPTYVPEDYQLTNSNAIKYHSLNLIFKKLSSKSILQIMESPRPANLHIMPDKYQTVTVRGQSCYLVKGTWYKSATTTNWGDNLCLWLVFNIEDWIVMLNGIPAKAWSEEELIKIAESMREYEG